MINHFLFHSAFLAPKEMIQRTGKAILLKRLVDIGSKRLDGKGAGYEKRPTLFNLKEAANTLNFLAEHEISDYNELAARADEAGEKFNALSARVKQVEARLRNSPGCTAASSITLIHAMFHGF